MKKLPNLMMLLIASLVLALFDITSSVAQETSSDPDTQPAVSEGASPGSVSPPKSTVIGPNDIMGFESLGTWSVSTNSIVPGFAVQSTAVRTQGKAAYAVSNPPTLFKLISSPVAYTATALAGIGERGALLKLDVIYPCGNNVPPLQEMADCDPADDGWIEGFISSRSLGLQKVSIGKVLFSNYNAGIYNTMSFAIPESVSSVLGTAKFTDLIFEFDVSSTSKISGTYLFDNLRVHSVQLVQSPTGEAPPAGYGGSVNLTVTGNKPVKQSFSLDPMQIPGGLHLKKGITGTTTVQFEGGLDTSTTFTCTYEPDSSDTSQQSYKLKSCIGNYRAGDILNVNWASLAIEGGEASQQVYAQLVLRPLGDLTGSGLLPAMPTFWGNADTCAPAPVAGKVVTKSTSCSSQTAQANSIITNYFNEVDSAHPSPNWIVAPVPESAMRRGNIAPTNHLSGASPAVTPDASNGFPFDTGGDPNPGGSWDAYWNLSGNLTPTAVAGTDENLTHFDATFAAHGVLDGNDVDMVDAKLTADSDSGETTPTYKPATSSGTLDFYVLGEEIPSGGLSFTPSTGFSIDPSLNKEFDLPPIQVWIFTIKLGALVDADLKVQGSAALSGADLSATPSASLGAHISGGIDLGIASGDVDAKVNLITLSAPVTAQAKWVLDNDPAVCASYIEGSLDGKLSVSSGGGQVDLDATLGYCPICVTKSIPLFKWPALASESWNLFTDQVFSPYFALPTSMCNLSINANIVSPTAGQSLSAGLPITLTGSVATNTTHATSIYYKWTFTPGANASTVSINPVGENSANPTVTFGAPTSGNVSTWTINLTATITVHSASGVVLTKTASAAPVTITITSLSPGDHVAISSQSNGPAVQESNGVWNVGNVPGTITFYGVVADAPSTPDTLFTVVPCVFWNIGGTANCIADGQTTILITVGADTGTPSASWTGFSGGYYLVTMTTTTGASTFSTATAIIYGTEIF